MLTTCAWPGQARPWHYLLKPSSAAPPYENSLFRQIRDVREEEVTRYPDQDEIDQQHQRPTEIVTNDFALVADELAGGNAEAGSLRRDRLCGLRAHRVERRQQHRRHAEQLPDQGLEFSEHGIGRGVTARKRHADKSEMRGHNDEVAPDLGKGLGKRSGHS